MRSTTSPLAAAPTNLPSEAVLRAERGRLADGAEVSSAVRSIAGSGCCALRRLRPGFVLITREAMRMGGHVSSGSSRSRLPLHCYVLLARFRGQCCGIRGCSVCAKWSPSDVGRSVQPVHSPAEQHSS